MTLVVQWRFDKEWGVLGGDNRDFSFRLEAEPEAGAPELDAKQSPPIEVKGRIIGPLTSPLGRAVLRGLRLTRLERLAERIDGVFIWPYRRTLERRDKLPKLETIELYPPTAEDDSTWRSRELTLPSPWLQSYRLEFELRNAEPLAIDHIVRRIRVIPSWSVRASFILLGLLAAGSLWLLLYILRTLQFSVADAGLGVGGGFLAFYGVWVRSLSTRARESWRLPDFGVGMIIGRTIVFVFLAGLLTVGVGRVLERHGLLTLVNRTGASLDLVHELEGKLELPAGRPVTVTSLRPNLVCNADGTGCEDLYDLIARWPEHDQYCFCVASSLSDACSSEDSTDTSLWWTLDAADARPTDGPERTPNSRKPDGCTPARVEKETQITFSPGGNQFAPRRVEVVCREQPWKEHTSLSTGSLREQDYDEEHLERCRSNEDNLCLRLGPDCSPPDAEYGAWVKQEKGDYYLRNTGAPEFGSLTAQLTLFGETDASERACGLNPWGPGATGVDLAPHLLVLEDASTIARNLGRIDSPGEFEVPADRTGFDLELRAKVPPTDRLEGEPGPRVRCQGVMTSGSLGEFDLYPVAYRDPSQGLVRLTLADPTEPSSSTWTNTPQRSLQGTAHVCHRRALNGGTTGRTHTQREHRPRLRVVLSPYAHRRFTIDEWQVPEEYLGEAVKPLIEIYYETANPESPRLIGVTECFAYPWRLLPLESEALSSVPSTTVEGKLSWRRESPGSAYACLAKAHDGFPLRATVQRRGVRGAEIRWQADPAGEQPTDDTGRSPFESAHRDGRLLVTVPERKCFAVQFDGRTLDILDERPSAARCARCVSTDRRRFERIHGRRCDLAMECTCHAR